MIRVHQLVPCGTGKRAGPATQVIYLPWPLAAAHKTVRDAHPMC